MTLSEIARIVEKNMLAFDGGTKLTKLYYKGKLVAERINNKWRYVK